MPGEPLWKGANAANFHPGRPAGFRPEAIVLHVMTGDLAGTDSWFNHPRSRVSAHYGVGRAGETHAYVRETDTAFHAGMVDRPGWRLLQPGVNPNFYTLGVTHEGAPGAWPEAQLAASAALVRAIAARWDIPLDGDHIVPHQAIRKGAACPGPGFDLNDYIARLIATLAPAPPAPTPADFTVKAMSTLRVRTAPTTASAIVRLLSRGDSWRVNGQIAAGEEVEGNALWYAGDGGQYIWAGATDRPNGG